MCTGRHAGLLAWPRHDALRAGEIRTRELGAVASRCASSDSPDTSVQGQSRHFFAPAFPTRNLEAPVEVRLVERPE